MNLPSTAALRSRGQKLALAPAAVVYQHRLGLRLEFGAEGAVCVGPLLRRDARQAGAPVPKRVFWAAFAPALPVLMMARMTSMAWRNGAPWARF